MTDNQLVRRLSALRPEKRPGWAGSAAGEEVLRRILATEPTPAGRAHRPTGRVLAVAGAVVLLAVVGVLAIVQPGASGPLGDPPSDAPTRHSIAGSYAFDVDNLPVLLDHADEVFVGRVVAVESNEEENRSRVYRVAVGTRLEGSAEGEVLVRQYGYVDGAGVVHLLDDQSMLRTGETYLLVTARQPSAGPLFVLGGAKSVVEIASDNQERDVVRQYRAAAAR